MTSKTMSAAAGSAVVGPDVAARLVALEERVAKLEQFVKTSDSSLFAR